MNAPDCLISRTRKRCLSGMTVLEVLVAVVILSLAFSSYLRFLTIGDKVRVQSLRKERAVLVGQSEAERLKAHSSESIEIGDTTYEAVSGKDVFIVDRHVIVDEFSGERDFQKEYSEIQILVKNRTNDSTLVTFRLLQPCREEEI